MNSYDICKAIIAFLKADTAFVAFCTATFAKQPNYYCGLDTNVPPPDGMIPFVVVMPMAIMPEPNQFTKHTLMVGSVCKDDSVTTASGTTDYSGYNTVIKFADALHAAADRFIAAQELAQTMSFLDASTANIALYFPYYHTSREYNFTTAY